MQEKRDRLQNSVNNHQTSNEITQLNQAIVDLENSSLIERMKKGFSKNDIEHHTNISKAAAEPQTIALSSANYFPNEITKIELDAPITSREADGF